MNEFLLNAPLNHIAYVDYLFFFSVILSFIWGLYFGAKAFMGFAITLKDIGKFFLLIVFAQLPIIGSTQLANSIDSLKQYSANELGDLVMDYSGELYKAQLESVKQVGNVQLKTKNRFNLLGKIDCKTFTFKQCVENIKQNKTEIVSNLEISGSFAVKE